MMEKEILIEERLRRITFSKNWKVEIRSRSQL
jgi:hypothetical protein